MKNVYQIHFINKYRSPVMENVHCYQIVIKHNLNLL